MTINITCAICNKAIPRVTSTVFRGVTGYVKPRTGGGSNAIRLMAYTDEYIHEHCANLAKNGFANQPELPFGSSSEPQMKT